ncbi:unnamed protein product [Closterium sp. Yama58-4]|nr:unnamed protein product [Closterium sp. Yama58-4]
MEVDPLSVTFRWQIDGFSKLTERAVYSNTFLVGGYTWRLMMYPEGSKDLEDLALFLGVANYATLPPGWTKHMDFVLTVVNQFDRTKSVRTATSQEKYSACSNNRGWNSIMPLKDLNDHSKGFLVNDTLFIEAEVKVCDKSKSRTGYVGLNNQGGLCCMSPLIQMLFYIPFFRKAVYRVPVSANDSHTGSILSELQNIFYKMQFTDTNASTKEFTKRFGWEERRLMKMKHDAHEVYRVLCTKLEEEMKGTSVEGSLEKLFNGHVMNYIECVNVDHKSASKEPFAGLLLNVKGCKDVYASLDKYVEAKNLDGNTKFYAEQHGVQDAKKGVLFVDLPPVLQLHLKRFEYRFWNTLKVKDRFEFPLELDMDKDSGKYLTTDLDRTGRNLYLLHSVLVHTDGVNDGHCYALIRPNLGSQWYKFDNEEVEKEQFKGDEELYTNAYMIVYIRQCDREKILCSNDVDGIAQPLQARLKRKSEEDQLTEIKVTQEEDLRQQIGQSVYVNLVDHRLVRSFRVEKQMRFSEFKTDVKKELGVPVARQRFWVWGKGPSEMSRPNKLLNSEEEGMTVGRLRNSLKRGSTAVQLFLQATPSSGRNKDDILLFIKFYDPMHSTIRYAGHLSVKPDNTPADVLERMKKLCRVASKEDILLFEESERSFGMGVRCVPVDKTDIFEDMQLEDGDILCVQKALTAAQKSGLKHPDVPSFLQFVQTQQVVHFRRLGFSKKKKKTKNEKRKLDNPDPTFFSFLISFTQSYPDLFFSHKITFPTNSFVHLLSSKQDTYDKVAERLAEKLRLADATKIRLTAHNCYSLQPRLPPIKYQGAKCLGEMLAHDDQASSILYFETLNVPLPELEKLATLAILDITFHGSKTNKPRPLVAFSSRLLIGSVTVTSHKCTAPESFRVLCRSEEGGWVAVCPGRRSCHGSRSGRVSMHTIQVDWQFTVADVLAQLKTKVELSHPEVQLRLLGVFPDKICQILPHTDKIENIDTQNWAIHAEEVQSR